MLPEPLRTILDVHSYGGTADQTAACVRGLHHVSSRQVAAGSVSTAVAMEIVDVTDAR